MLFSPQFHPNSGSQKMEMVPGEMLTELAGWCSQSRSTDKETARAAAEQKLSSTSPDYAIALLALATSSDHSLVDRVDASIRFKELLHRCWPKPSNTGAAGPRLPASDRAVIKASLLGIYIKAPPTIQAHLCEAMAVAASSSDLAEWNPQPLPVIISLLGNSVSNMDFTAINSLLRAAGSLLSRFRQVENNSLRLDVKYCINLFAPTLLDVFLFATGQLLNQQLDVCYLCSVLESIRLCCQILYSLKSIQLSDLSLSENYMGKWTVEFLKLLTISFTPLEEAGGVMHALLAAVCDNLRLHMDKYGDNFQGCLTKFVEAVTRLVVAQTSSPLFHSELVVAAMRFLTAVAESVHYRLVSGSELFDAVILPNLQLRYEDERLFHENWIEYVRRDSYVIDVSTPRQAALSMLDRLVKNSNDEMTAIVVEHINRTVNAYLANPEGKWREMEAATYIVVGHCTEANTRVLTSVIVPEQQPDDFQAMLKSTMLCYLKNIAAKVPKTIALSLLPTLVRFLTHRSKVVIFYAASCIESLLISEDTPPLTKEIAFARAPFVSSDINPFCLQIVQDLTNAIVFPHSYGNQCLMKCILEVLRVACLADQSTNDVIAHLLDILGKVCNNPKNPDFNKYLFEALALVIGWANVHKSLLPVFEARLTVFGRIFSGNIIDLWPYALQILAQLVNLRKAPLSQNYLHELDGIVLCSTWDRPTCVPAAALLLGAYLRKISSQSQACQSVKVEKILIEFNSRIWKRPPDYSAFHMINMLVEHVGKDIMNHHIDAIWSDLVRRVSQTSDDVKFSCSVVVWISLVRFKYGLDVFIHINKVFKHVFTWFLQKHWIPNIKWIKGSHEVKLTVFASTKVLCEYQVLLDAAPGMWGELLDGVITLLSKMNADEMDCQKAISFTLLQNAGLSEDLLKNVDLAELLVTSLVVLHLQYPGRLGPIIEKHVHPTNKIALGELCASYGTTVIS